MKSAITAAVVLLLVVGVTAAFVYSGAYNVAADEPHWPITESLLNVLRKRSIETRARALAPPDLVDEKRIAAGASQYAEMCESCHLAPGIAESELRKGLYPKPPELARRAHGDAREMFWIVKHGIKATGMPAWGPTHDDETLWNVVAFLQKLPQLDEKGYRELVEMGEPHTPIPQHGKAADGHSHGAKPHTH
ncbi:MAG: cytochrome c [Burkholderiales bacterium]